MPTDTRAVNAARQLSNGRDIGEHGVQALLSDIAQYDFDSLGAMAKAWECSKPYLSDVIRGNRRAGPKILAKLGLDRVVTIAYRRTEPAHAD